MCGEVVAVLQAVVREGEDPHRDIDDWVLWREIVSWILKECKNLR